MNIVSRIILLAALLACAPSAWAGWGLPTGSSDEGPEAGNTSIPWANLNLAYDAGTSPPIGNYSSTYATNGQSIRNKAQVGNFADFTFTTAYCDYIGVYADSGTPVDYVQIDVWDTAGAGSWVRVCGSTPLVGTFPANGVLQNDTWTAISVRNAGVPRNISKIRFRFHYTSSANRWTYWLWDIAYHTAPTSPTIPTVATLTPDIDLNSAVLQGQIIDDSGLVCTPAYFEYGNSSPGTYNLGTVPVVPSDMSYSFGMVFGAFLGGLTTGQTYHYRAVATNNVGLGYGADVAFTPVDPGDGWIDPTSNAADPSPPANAQQWQNRVSAYDDDDQTFATLSINTTDTSPTTYLYLYHSAITCDKIRFKASTSTLITDLQIWIQQSGTTWTQIATVTTYTNEQWYEVTVPTANQASVTGARIRLDITTGSGFVINLSDFDFHVKQKERAWGFIDGAFSGANK